MYRTSGRIEAYDKLSNICDPSRLKKQRRDTKEETINIKLLKRHYRGYTPEYSSAELFL